MGANLRKLDWEQIDPAALQGAGDVLTSVQLFHRFWIHGVLIALIAGFICAGSVLKQNAIASMQASQALTDFANNLTILEPLPMEFQLDMVNRERIGFQRSERNVRAASRESALKVGNAWTSVRRNALAGRIDQSQLRAARSAAELHSRKLEGQSSILSTASMTAILMGIVGLIGIAFLIRTALRKGGTTLVVQSVAPTSSRGYQTDISASTKKESDAITSAVNNLPAAIFEFESDGRIVRWNRAMARLTAIPPEQAIGQSVIQCLGWSQTAEAAKSSIRKIFSGETVGGIAWEYTPAKGVSLWFEADLMPVIDRSGAVRSGSATVRDITVERLGRNMLNANDQARLALIKAIPDTLLRFDAAMNLVELHDNRHVFSPEANLRGTAWMEAFPEGLRANLVEAAKQARLTQLPQNFEFSGLMEGRIRSFSFRVTVSGSSDVLAVLSEIGGRRNAEEDDQRSEPLFRQIFNGSPDPLLMLSSDQIILHASAECGRLFGIPADALVGRNWIELLHKDSRAQGEEFWRTALKGGSGVLKSELTLVGQEDAINVVAAFANLFNDPEVSSGLISFRTATGTASQPTSRPSLDPDALSGEIHDYLSAITKYAESGSFGCLMVQMPTDRTDLAKVIEMARAVTQSIAQACGVNDIIGQTQFNEILVILPEASQDSMESTCQLINANLETMLPSGDFVLSSTYKSTCQCSPSGVLEELRSKTNRAHPSAA